MFAMSKAKFDTSKQDSTRSCGVILRRVDLINQIVQVSKNFSANPQWWMYNLLYSFKEVLEHVFPRKESAIQIISCDGMQIPFCFAFINSLNSLF